MSLTQRVSVLKWQADNGILVPSANELNNQAGTVRHLPAVLYH